MYFILCTIVGWVYLLTREEYAKMNYSRNKERA